MINFLTFVITASEVGLSPFFKEKEVTNKISQYDTTIKQSLENLKNTIKTQETEYAKAEAETSKLEAQKNTKKQELLILDQELLDLNSQIPVIQEKKQQTHNTKFDIQEKIENQKNAIPTLENEIKEIKKKIKDKTESQGFDNQMINILQDIEKQDEKQEAERKKRAQDFQEELRQNAVDSHKKRQEEADKKVKNFQIGCFVLFILAAGQTGKFIMDYKKKQQNNSDTQPSDPANPNNQSILVK